MQDNILETYSIQTSIKFKRIFSFMLTLTLLLSLPTSSFANTKSEIEPVTDISKEPKAYIVVDAVSGAILKSKNEHEAMQVASISKIVTALGAINTIKVDKGIIATDEAQNVEPSKIGMNAGQIWKRDDLINSLLLISANDAAYALAIASAGSIEGFEKTQNDIARNLGMQDSTFGDPSGLDDSNAINGSTSLSAYDVAIASRSLLANPELATIVAKENYQFTGGDGLVHTFTNHNEKFLSGYSGATGLKTGYTKKSGRTIAVSAKRDGNSIIAIVLDVQESTQWGAKLLDDGFEAMKKAQKDNTDLSKSKNKLPEISAISTEAGLTKLIEPSTNKNSKSSIAKKSTSTTKSVFINLTNISLFILLLIGLLLYLRIRSVKKRRLKRKLERQKMLEIQRRRMLDVIDLTNEDKSGLISKK